jgi:hypothetical protein
MNFNRDPCHFLMVAGVSQARGGCPASCVAHEHVHDGAIARWSVQYSARRGDTLWADTTQGTPSPSGVAGALPSLSFALLPERRSRPTPAGTRPHAVPCTPSSVTPSPVTPWIAWVATPAPLACGGHPGGGAWSDGNLQFPLRSGLCASMRPALVQGKQLRRLVYFVNAPPR